MLKAQRALAVVIFGPAVLLVGYVLSMGPTARLTDDGRLEFVTWVRLYRPLLMAGDEWSPVADALGWYTGKWGGEIRSCAVPLPALV